MERKKIILPILLLTGIFILNFFGVANAADNNSAVNEVTSGLSGGGAGFGTTFQTQLSNLSKKFVVVGKNNCGDNDGGGRLYGLFRNTGQ